MPLAIPLCFQLFFFFLWFWIVGLFNHKYKTNPKAEAKCNILFGIIFFVTQFNTRKKGMHRKYTFTNRFPLMLARY